MVLFKIKFILQLLYLYVDRYISMIVAKKSYDSFLVGNIAKFMNSVPVVRQRVTNYY
jgi:hypothetical protein